MSVPFAALFALASALPAPPSLPARTSPAALQETEGEALRLLPDDAVILVRLESIDALLELVKRFGEASGAPAFSASELLEDLNLPGDVSQIDSARPLWFALAASSKAPAPVMTFAVPARDSQALVDSIELADQGMALAAGGYVGISTSKSYAIAAEPSSLASKLRPGLISLHMDLATLIEAYREFIETGLDTFEAQMDEMAPAMGGPDMAPVFEAYVDLAWDLIDSADMLDVAFARNGPALELQGSLSTLEGSPMAGWGSGTPVELPPWPAQIDPNATMSMASAGDWALLMQRMKPMTEASVSVYPEGMRGFMRECLAASEAMYALMGPTFASFDFGPGGIRAGYIATSEKPAELYAQFTSLMGKLPQGESGLGLSFSAPEQVTFDKVQAQRFHLEIDPIAFARASLDEQDAPADLDAVQQSMAESMAKLWGENGLDLTVATHPKSVALALGGDEAFVRSVLVERGPAGASLPPELQRALATVKGSSTAVVYRLDLGRLMKQIGELMPEESAEFDVLSVGPLPMCMWGSIRGREWSSGVSVDFESLLALVTAAAELKSSPADDPELSRAVVQMDLSMIGGAVELYAAQHGKYPESLQDLVTLDAAGQSFLVELPLDPWKNPYVYEPPLTPDARFRVVSYGADGAPGGEGPNADIDYESLRSNR